MASLDLDTKEHEEVVSQNKKSPKSKERKIDNTLKTQQFRNKNF
jgi:hypothetical protein